MRRGGRERRTSGGERHIQREREREKKKREGERDREQRDSQKLNKRQIAK